MNTGSFTFTPEQLAGIEGIFTYYALSVTTPGVRLYSARPFKPKGVADTWVMSFMEYDKPWCAPLASADPILQNLEPIEYPSANLSSQLLNTHIDILRLFNSGQADADFIDKHLWAFGVGRDEFFAAVAKTLELCDRWCVG